jgi:hypothetical protein
MPDSMSRLWILSLIANALLLILGYRIFQFALSIRDAQKEMLHELRRRPNDGEARYRTQGPHH